MISLVFSAHLVTTGLGPLFDGIGHAVVTPQDLLPVVAIALLAGLGGKAYARKVLFILPAAWLVGGLLGLTLRWSAPLGTTALSFLILGGLGVAQGGADLVPGVGKAQVGLYLGPMLDELDLQPLLFEQPLISGDDPVEAVKGVMSLNLDLLVGHDLFLPLKFGYIYNIFTL